MKVLIVTPHLQGKGGVAIYYSHVRKYLSIEKDFFEVGARKESESFLKKPANYFIDCYRFFKLLREKQKEYDLIHLNPSLNWLSLIRDGTLLNVARRFNKTTILFFRGIDPEVSRKIDKYLRKLFFITFNGVDAFIVLSSRFERQLRKWGFSQPIFLETTLVDDELLRGFTLQQRYKRIESRSQICLLFLSRLIRNKGIMETLLAFQRICREHSNLTLRIAGTGPFLNDLVKHVFELGLTDRVEILGFVSGETKRETMIHSDIYVLPTYHGEGLPNSILEAMAFGLPVITTPVGGIPDIFSNGKHGYLIPSPDPALIADAIKKVLADRENEKRICAQCYLDSQRFLASRGAKRLEKIYEFVLKAKQNISLKTDEDQNGNRGQRTLEVNVDLF